VPRSPVALDISRKNPRHRDHHLAEVTTTGCTHARDVGLPDIRLHHARHTSASLMLALGYPVHVVAAWLGHDPVMTQRVYAHVHAAEMRSLGEAFGQTITRDQ
jgi:integrase